MAIMTSPPTEGLVLDQKPTKLTSTAELLEHDEPNGTTVVNGYVLPPLFSESPRLFFQLHPALLLDRQNT